MSFLVSRWRPTQAAATTAPLLLCVGKVVVYNELLLINLGINLKKIRHGGLMHNVVINMCEKFITIGRETTDP